MVSMTLKLVGKQQNILHIGHHKFLKSTNVILIVHLQILMNKYILFVTNMSKLIVLNIVLVAW